MKSTRQTTNLDEFFEESESRKSGAGEWTRPRVAVSSRPQRASYFLSVIPSEARYEHSRGISAPQTSTEIPPFSSEATVSRDDGDAWPARLLGCFGLVRSVRPRWRPRRTGSARPVAPRS